MSFKQNITWNIFGGLGAKILAPIFQILIARIIDPSEYGLFALAMAIVYLYEVFKDVGITDSILARQGKEAEISTLYTVQTISGIVSYSLLLVIVLIGLKMDYLSPKLVLVVLVTCLGLFLIPTIDSITTRFRVKQNYKIVAFRQFVFTIVSGFVGLIAAYIGFQGLSLAIGFVAGYAVTMAYLWTVNSGMTLAWRLDKFGQHVPIGKHVMFQRWCGFLVYQGDSFVINYIFGSFVLGKYRMAHQINNLVPHATILYANQVLFTKFSELDAVKKYKNIESIYFKYSIFTGLGLLMLSVLIYFSAPQVITVILGEAWTGVAPIVIILSCGLATGAMVTPNNDLAKIWGFTNLYSLYALARGLVSIAVLITFSKYGIIAAAAAWTVSGICLNLVNELIFNIRQKFISVLPIKLPLICLNIVWLVFVLTKVSY